MSDNKPIPFRTGDKTKKAQAEAAKVEKAPTPEQMAAPADARRFLLKAMVEKPARRFVDVYCPAEPEPTWVRLGAWRALEKESWEADMTDARQKDPDSTRGHWVGLRERGIARSVLDPETNERVFQDGDWEMIGNLQYDTISLLWREVDKLNATTQATKEAVATDLRKSDVGLAG